MQDILIIFGTAPKFDVEKRRTRNATRSCWLRCKYNSKRVLRS